MNAKEHKKLAEQYVANAGSARYALKEQEQWARIALVHATLATIPDPDPMLGRLGP